jgi:hypothetical protein
MRVFILRRVVGAAQTPHPFGRGLSRGRSARPVDPRRESVALMTRRQGIEAALAAWRDAERRLEAHLGDPDDVMAEIAADQAEFQRLCAQDVTVPSDSLIAAG